MTLHESKHPGYSDLGRLHQHFIGDAAPLQPSEGSQGTPTGSVMPSMPSLPSMPPMPSMPSMPSMAPPGAAPSDPGIGGMPAPPPGAAPAGPSATQRGAGGPGEQVQPRRPQRALYKHADLGRFRTDAGGSAGHEDDCFDRLARLAEPESWSGPAAAGRHDGTWVLREYVEWAFERLHGQRQVVTSPDGAHSAFSTGLVTVQQEPIYGLFAPNRNPDGPPWQLQGWCADGDRQLADHFPKLPAMATYAETPAELVFDWRRPLTVSTKHLLESKENLAVLPGPLRSNPYQAGLVLEGAVRRAEARARRNYRTAVPCWDPVTERVELLLPLALTTPDTADVALLVTGEGDAYHGHTVLGLDVAYARARQIARPEEWLRCE